MQVVLELDAVTGARVRELAARGEREAVLRLLAGPLGRAVDGLLTPATQLPLLCPEEVERLLDEQDHEEEAGRQAVVRGIVAREEVYTERVVPK